jgi:N-terminal domain on NACHT_NTPase and P-loop NTPases
MSGVEILGAVASAVQLADTCMKIAICAIDLFSRVRDAPETIRKRIVAVQQLVEVARLIEHNPSLQTPLIASVLTRARADADQLFEILTKIDAQPSAGKVVKYWKALEGITREKRILAICDRLQENKALLTLYIASINS